MRRNLTDQAWFRDDILLIFLVMYGPKHVAQAIPSGQTDMPLRTSEIKNVSKVFLYKVDIVYRDKHFKVLLHQYDFKDLALKLLSSASSKFLLADVTVPQLYCSSSSLWRLYYLFPVML